MRRECNEKVRASHRSSALGNVTPVKQLNMRINLCLMTKSLLPCGGQTQWNNVGVMGDTCPVYTFHQRPRKEGHKLWLMYYPVQPDPITVSARRQDKWKTPPSKTTHTHRQ
ncbi:hypothetical protein Bbelb_124700 [Branchiostoma belcheri]|nr:hypothetical protein Bbelb_124700 [Branchiostoma belcheri]